MVMTTSGCTYTFIQLRATYEYTYCDISDGPSDKVDLKHAPHGSRAFWPFTYACDMNTAFTRIEELKGSGANSKAAFIGVVGSTWSSSTFSDHHQVWKACPSNIMLGAVRKGRSPGGEWKTLAKGKVNDQQVVQISDMTT